MSKTFAEVVEAVKLLSFAEKQQLQELLREYALIEERRSERGVRRRSGSAKDEIFMSPDFDEPIEDVADYTE